MDADFNTPDALGGDLRPGARDQHAARAQARLTERPGHSPTHAASTCSTSWDSTFAAKRRAISGRIDPYVELLLEVRRKLRDVKQWALADEIRTRLGDLGVTVEDRPGGESTWRLDDF